MTIKTIIVVTNSLAVGGTERHVSQVFPKLNPEQFQVIFYLTAPTGSTVFLEYLQEKGFKVYSSDFCERLHRLGKIGVLCASFVNVLRLTVLNLYYRPEVVHCYLPGSYILGGIAAFITRRPYLLMSRRSMNHYQFKRPWVTKIERFLYKKTTKIVANSKKVFNQLLNEEGIKKEKLRLIYNGIDCCAYENSTATSSGFRHSVSITENALVMTIVANLFPYKRHIDLLLALTGDALAQDWVLVCVGRDQGCLLPLSQFAKTNGIAGNIRWLGERKDVPEILAHSDIGILCSSEEGFSNSILEGMASGLPMIVTDVGGNAEAVVHDQTGLVVPTREPVALRAAIVRLAEDPLLRQRMGAKGLARVRQNFSLAHCVDTYEALYSELA